MKITYIAWGKVVCSDVNRLIYATKGNGLHNTGDQAIQNFNVRNENPGLWSGFTGGMKVPRKIEVKRNNREYGTNNPTTFDIQLENSVNKLRLWEDKNDDRGNPIKINHEIWDRNGLHGQSIIETWYLGYMRILLQLLNKLKGKYPQNKNVDILRDYVSTRLAMDLDISSNLLKWIHATQDGFAGLTVDTSFMANDSIKDIKGFVEDNCYIVIMCEDNGEIKNFALMAHKSSANLHPRIKELLNKSERGGEYVDIDISVESESAQILFNKLLKYHNIILYGPPGTGKTHMLMELMNSFGQSASIDPLDTESPIKSSGLSLNSSETLWCTFHPSYTYENFVYGIVPKVVNKQLGFQTKIGPFLTQAKKAEQGIPSMLIVDEINRGKTGDIFGDMLPVIDHDSKGNVRFVHPVITPETIISEVSSSDNLYVVGTMNSLDKSTSPLTNELKNRFTLIEVMPDVSVLRSHLEKNTNIPNDLKNCVVKLWKD